MKLYYLEFKVKINLEKLQAKLEKMSKKFEKAFTQFELREKLEICSKIF